MPTPAVSDSPRPDRAGRLGRGIWLVVLAGLLAYVPGAFTRGVWRVDAVRLVSVSQQMGAHGHLLVPHLNGEVYAEKPPFLNWLIVLVHTLVDDWTVAAHLVVALLAVLAALAVARIGLLLSDSGPVAVLAALFFLSIGAVAAHARQVTFDIGLTAWVLWAVAFLLAAGHARGAAWGRAACGAALASAAACLTKGPVGLLHIAVAVVALRLIARRTARVPWRTLGLALGFGVGSTLLWVYLASTRVGPWFWDKLVLFQTTSRLGPRSYHGEPWTYYFENLASEYLPYALLAAGLVAFLIRSRRERTGLAVLGRAACTWGLSGVALFSAIGAKRPGYVLPLAASFVLLSAGAVAAADVRPRSRESFCFVRLPLLLVTLLLGLGALAGLALPFLSLPSLAARTHASWLTALTPERLGALAATAALALGASGFAVARLCRGRLVDGSVWMALGLCLGLGGTGYAVQGAMEPLKSPRVFIAQAFETMPPTAVPVLLGTDLEGRVNLYTGRAHFDVLGLDALPGPGAADAWPAWLIAPDWAFARGHARLDPLYEVVLERRMQDRVYLLLRRRAPGPGPR